MAKKKPAKDMSEALDRVSDAADAEPKVAGTMEDLAAAVVKGQVWHIDAASGEALPTGMKVVQETSSMSKREVYEGGDEIQIELTGDLDHNGTRYRAGDTVKLPRALVLKKPWLSKFGQALEGITTLKITEAGLEKDPKRRI
ncbi:MAG: hypothetical protein ACE5FA_04735 [Dehalococcoidia bacterium]